MRYRVRFKYMNVIWNGQIRVTDLSITTSIYCVYFFLFRIFSISYLTGSLVAHAVLKLPLNFFIIPSQLLKH